MPEINIQSRDIVPDSLLKDYIVFRNHDIEGQVSKSDGEDSGRKRTRIGAFLEPEGRLLRGWKIMFAVSCVIAVSVDPLFFYLPIINRDDISTLLDKRLQIIVYSLRSVTDLIYLLNIILQFICPYIEKGSRKLGRKIIVRNPRQIANHYFFSRYFVIDVLAILPLPQVSIPIGFSKISYSNYLAKRKFLNTLVFLQYVPRVLRIYISWMDLSKPDSKLFRIVWVKAAFNFFLYILSSHVLGAFWYLLSIQRETACWHIAWHKNHDPLSIKDWCSVETPNTTNSNSRTPKTGPFDYGIFLPAIQSDNLETTDFSQKLAYCFWWGLRNLSSFGQNLQTSVYFWENFFAISVSIIALLLFLYFIGNVQTYRQLATERSEEIIQSMKVKEREIDIWRDRNKLPNSMKEEIMENVQRLLKEMQDVDVQNLLSYLPIELGMKIKCHICLPLLKKVPQLQGKSEKLLLLICDYLMPVHYNKHSYIVHAGEPLDAMLFITQGIIWNFTTINGERSAECIEGGSFYGEQLLEWGLNSPAAALPNLSNLPISSKTAKTHTKVEAFALMANDLRTIVSRRTEAASTLPATVHTAFRRLYEKKKNEKSRRSVEGKKKIEMSCSWCFKTS
ncbi:cyclic nucleotide-gated ion channel 1-like [Corylus avellana]|uniref:cyclic nucleotide-gated ion channel 1-like n=1 Tax=Corylus avellana TaxID=13451 RepID=UPI00286CFF7A|nr:cyclic nucleotide-gated ion channel 1-like [Corylus avellana]